VGTAFALTEQQEALVALARQLGSEHFGPRAAAHDVDATFPFANYDDLRTAGLLRLCVPVEDGGLGADFQTYCLVAAELGRHCGATALTFNMHSCTCMWAGQVCDDLPLDAVAAETHRRRRSAIYRMVVEEGALFAQPFSEPNHAVAAGRAPFGTTAERVPGGWSISGAKHFASLAGAATHYGVLCTEDIPGKAHDARDTVYLAVAADSPGFTVTGTWDPVGMRGTVSRSLLLDDVFVPEDRAVMPQGAYYRAAVDWPHIYMTISATYMGITEAALDFTVRYLRGEVPGGPEAQRSSTSKQLAVAQMRVKVEAARALWERAIAEAGFRPSRDARMRALAAHQLVTETANEVASLALRTCGGRAIARAFPLERYYRDSRCGSLMLPWTAEICLERLGHGTLYEAGERD
jgi:alkylation response protein AidB-like acyl-CoA dehydrogenase